MLSSIFSSEPRHASKAIAVLLAVLAAYFVALETMMLVLIPHVSNSAIRERQDRARVSTLRQQVSTVNVLAAGNSLLLHGVDREAFQQGMGDSVDTAFLPVENTGFYDWYFGLRRLFSEGTQPSVVMLSINLRQLMSNTTNGEAFAHSMMRRQDLIQVARATNLDNTTASGYFFASYSAWLGGRTGFRNWLLEQWLPGAGLLVESFVPRQPPPVPAEVIVREDVRRLKLLKELGERYGARFVYAVPATRNTADPGLALQAAAAAEGLTVLVPFKPGEMPAEAYSDGLHLNQRGALLYTNALVPLLRQALHTN